MKTIPSKRTFATVALAALFVTFFLTLMSQTNLAGAADRATITFTKDEAASNLLPGATFGSVGESSDGQYIVVTGCKTDTCDEVNRISELYKNTGGTLTKDATTLISLKSSSVDWGDMDDDGDEDLLMVGHDGSNRKAFVYKQDPAGTFTAIAASSTISGTESAAAAWGDIDGDNDLDILITGQKDGNFNTLSVVYKNNGDDTFTEVESSKALLPQVYNGGVAMADFDKDGKDDILISGSKGFGQDNVTELYLSKDNNGSPTFQKQEAVSTALPNSAYKTVQWADMDDDGDLDILLAGSGGGSFFRSNSDQEANGPQEGDPAVAIYKNDGQNGYTQLSVTLPQLTEARADWADMEGDGDLDLLLSGNDPDTFEAKVEVYENTDGSSYTLIAGSSALPGITGGAYWIDIDGDKVLDVVLSGSDSSFAPMTEVYINSAEYKGEPAGPTPTPGPTATPIPVTECQNKRCYVNGAATGANNGTSWANAFTDLQSALAIAKEGDEIWVAKGTYSPGPEDTDTFKLIDKVAIFGGFTGIETDKSERNWVTYKTTLTGNSVNGHVVTSAGATETTLLDGVSITRGSASGLFPSNCGGGMYNNNSSPTLNNVSFSNNSAGIGGGMCNTGSNSSPTLNNVTFSNNSAGTGGGMYNTGSNPTLNNVTFSNNSAGTGGGMYNTGSNSTLNNVTFSNNSADTGGGGMYNISSSPTLTHVTFSNNSADLDGGGMYNISSSPTLIDVTFTSNSANTGGGGGMRNRDSSPTLTHVTFSSNSANTGGGMYNDNSSPTLINSIVWGNTATGGPNIGNVEQSVPVISYSLIEGSGGSNDWQAAFGTDGGNNIAVDPMFVDAAKGNLNLKLGSPAIDMGDNEKCGSTPLDGDGDGTATCDIGAFEAGTIRSITATGPISFNEIPNVTFDFTDLGSELDSIYIDTVDGVHHQPSDGEILLQTGGTTTYWRIKAVQADKTTTATGFTVDITLPHPNLPNPEICRFDSDTNKWDCGHDSFTSTSVTRLGVTGFSDWLVIPENAILTNHIYLPVINQQP